MNNPYHVPALGNIANSEILTGIGEIPLPFLEKKERRWFNLSWNQEEILIALIIVVMLLEKNPDWLSIILLIVLLFSFNI